MEKTQLNRGPESIALASAGKISSNISKWAEKSILGLSLLLSLVGFSISLSFLGRFYTPKPVEIHCDKEDLARMDRAGELMRQILQK